MKSIYTSKKKGYVEFGCTKRNALKFGFFRIKINLYELQHVFMQLYDQQLAWSGSLIRRTATSKLPAEKKFS